MDKKMTEPHDCDHCGNRVSLIMRVDFGNGWDDIEVFDCPEWWRMTDEEDELSKDGKCPYWVPVEDDGGDRNA